MASETIGDWQAAEAAADIEAGLAELRAAGWTAKTPLRLVMTFLPPAAPWLAPLAAPEALLGAYRADGLVADCKRTALVSDHLEPEITVSQPVPADATAVLAAEARLVRLAAQHGFDYWDSRLSPGPAVEGDHA